MNSPATTTAATATAIGAGAGAGGGAQDLEAAVAACARRTALGALGWLGAHREEFGLGPDPLAAGGDPNRTWKPLGELARLCGVVTRLTDPGDELHQAASALLAHAWQLSDRGRLLSELMRLEPFATYPLEVYAAFACGGLRQAGVERAAAAVAGARGWRRAEQQPNRRLGVAAAEAGAGLAPHEPAGVLLRRTWLGALPEPWTFERASGYTATHVVFHLTDWGLRPDAMPDDVARYLQAWLPPWLETCVEDHQWDLTCELLAGGASLPRALPAALTGGVWAALSQAQDRTGAVPEAGPAGCDAGPWDFWSCYHSTAMAALAAVLTWRRGTCARRRPGEAATRGRSGRPTTGGRS